MSLSHSTHESAAGEYGYKAEQDAGQSALDDVDKVDACAEGEADEGNDAVAHGLEELFHALVKVGR